MFSKYDVYTTVQSLYCYPDSDVLKNKLNIRDRDELKRAEEEITALKQYMLMESPIKGRDKGNVEYLAWWAKGIRG